MVNNEGKSIIESQQLIKNEPLYERLLIYYIKPESAKPFRITMSQKTDRTIGSTMR
jgi:hypothetical protein